MFRTVLPLSLAALLVAPVARADVSITVLPYAPIFGELPQSSGDKAAEYLRAELAESGEGLKLVDPVEGGTRAKAVAKKTGEDEVAAAKRQVAQAVAAFGRAEALAKSRKVKPAVDAYEKAIQQFVANFHGADDFKPLSDAYLALAVSRFKLGNEDGAFRALEDLVRVDPERVLGKTDAAALIIAQHDKARAAYFARQRGDVRVATTPAGAVVSLDGREVGETPVVLRDVLPGEHYVRVTKAGEGAAWKKVTVASGQEAELSAEFTALPTGPLSTIAAALGANRLDAATVAAAKQVGTASKADFVVFGALHRNNLSMDVRSYVVRAKDGAFAELAPIVFDLEMLSASIDVYKLAADLDVKIGDFPGAALAAALVPFPGVKAGASDQAFAEVRVTGRTASVPKDRDVVAEEAPSRGGRAPIVRAPVQNAVVERRGPVAAEPPAAEPARRRRERVVIGDNAEPVRPADEVEYEEMPRQQPNLMPASAPVSGDLSPEQLARLKDIDEGGKSKVGKIALWTTAGVVGAGLIGAGIYFLASPSAPASATAHVTWTP